MKKVFYLVVLSVALLYSCSNDDDAKTSIPENQYSIKLSTHSTHGEILTDADDKTLYFFSNDTEGMSMCAGGCLEVWPVFYAEVITTDDGLETEDFATITREDGAKQTTYKGRPLYYFASDANAGDTKGDGINDVWFVAKTDYSLMYVNAQLLGNDGKNYVINEDGQYVEGEGKTMYITDSNGRTLYIFTKDKEDTNVFTNEEFSNNNIWPIYYTEIDRLPSVLNKVDFGAIKVHGQRDQLTYKGWPVYQFGNDTEKGDNKGVSVPMPGIWPIIHKNTVVATD